MAHQSLRKRMGGDLPALLQEAGGDTASLAHLYAAAERRYGTLLDRSPDPARATQEKWQHDLRWELQSAVNEGRIVKRDDLGRGIYSLPGFEDSLASRRDSPLRDAILTVPASHDVERWKTFDVVYAPGRGRPRYIGVGSRLWLRYRGRLVWRWEVLGLHRDEARLSTMDGREHGPGWSIHVALGEEADVSDEDLGLVGSRRAQGIWYLDPESMRIAGAARRPRIVPRVRLTDVETASQEPVVAHTREAVAVWRRIEARLLDDWIAWCGRSGRSVRRLVVRTEEGTTLKTDAFDETTRLLVEAKGSSSREHVRMAIGQLLDYWSLLRDEARGRAILLPHPPSNSIQTLLVELEIGLIYPTLDEFTERIPQI